MFTAFLDAFGVDYGFRTQIWGRLRQDSFYYIHLLIHVIHHWYVLFHEVEIIYNDKPNLDYFGFENG